MNRVSTLGLLAAAVFLTGLAGCKTEVNNPPAQNTVIREDRPRDSGPDKVVIHDRAPDNKPDVQNNIKVDR